MDQRASTALLGVETPIRKAVWQRILNLGAPRMMTCAWACGMAWVALAVFNSWGFRWMLAVPVLWAVGQVTLALLTSWNPRWDNALCARWNRRYQKYYP